MSGGSHNAAPGSVSETFRDFWHNRPVRPRAGGKIGGVSAALGLRYGVDPVLLRVAFVVGAFYGGAGIFLYLLGWLLLPKETTPGTAPQGNERTSAIMTVLLAIMLIPASFAVFDFTGLLGITVGLAALYFLHRNYAERGQLSTGARTLESPSGGSGADGAVAPGETTGTGSAQEPLREQPPAWDPLGAAPFAWDLPEPGEPASPPEPPARRRWPSYAVSGLALIAVVLTYALTGQVETASAVALGVLGAGLVVASFLRGGRGLVVVSAFVAMVTIALNGSSLDDEWQGVSDTTIVPTSLGEVRPHYGTSLGSIELDLTRAGIAGNQQLATTVEVGMGEIIVTVPPEADVTARCSADRGQVECLSEEQGGEHAPREVTDFGPDGPGGGKIDLDLLVDSGSVEVRRG